MRACSTPGGGVMFVFDVLEVKACEKTPVVSYHDLAGADVKVDKSTSALERLELFAKKIAALKKGRRVA